MQGSLTSGKGKKASRAKLRRVALVKRPWIHTTGTESWIKYQLNILKMNKSQFRLSEYFINDMLSVTICLLGQHDFEYLYCIYFFSLHSGFHSSIATIWGLWKIGILMFKSKLM